jgi:hypothetical protein
MPYLAKKAAEYSTYTVILVTRRFERIQDLLREAKRCYGIYTHRLQKNHQFEFNMAIPTASHTSRYTDLHILYYPRYITYKNKGVYVLMEPDIRTDKFPLLLGVVPLMGQYKVNF